MKIEARKIRIWIVSLAAIFVVYFVYSQFNKTPSIPTQRGGGTKGGGQKFDENVGMVSGVGVGTIVEARFKELNKDKTISREFGFSKLLHKAGSEWQIEKPFMDIYKPEFKCSITADIGKVIVEEAAGRPTPKDAILSGNVVIHVIPRGNSRLKDTKIFFDDIAFYSERSLFTTEGPLRVASEDIQMKAKGLELIYNDMEGQLEFLRIPHLDVLQIKSTAGKSFAAAQNNGERIIGKSKKIMTMMPLALIGSDKILLQAAKKSDVSSSKERALYKCVFDANVVIDGPEQLVMANKLYVKNISFSGNSDSQTSRTKPAAESNVKPQDTNAVNAGTSGKGDTQANAEYINLTCDNGIVMSMMNSNEDADYLKKTSVGMPDANRITARNKLPRNSIFADVIDYYLLSGDVNIPGKSEITFYSKDAAAKNKEMMPVKIISNDNINYSAALNRIIFAGDCLCTAYRDVNGTSQNYSLAAETLTVVLGKKKTEGSSVGGTGQIESIVADGSSKLVFYADKMMGEKTSVPITITAQKEARFLPVQNQIIFDGNCRCVGGEVGVEERYSLATPKLTINLLKGKVKDSASGAGAIESLFAEGPAALMFRTGDIAGSNAGASLPVTVSAKKEAKFLPLLKRVIFDGDTVTTMTRTDGEIMQKYMLTAPLLTIYLTEGGKQTSAKSATGVDNIVADGGIIRLASVKKSGEKLITAAELKCQKFDFKSDGQVMTAAGPGVIKVDNSNAPMPEKESGKFSLSKPSWAVIRDFDVLNYYLKTNKIVANSSKNTMSIDYTPVINGEYGDKTEASCGHIEAEMYQTAGGQSELGKLSATNGVTYNEAGKDRTFAGNELLYDSKKGTMIVKGDEYQAAYLNGVRVDQIQYNLKTGKVNANVVGPSVFQIKK